MQKVPRSLLFTFLTLSLAACGQQTAPSASSRESHSANIDAQGICSTVATRLVTLVDGEFFSSIRQDAQGNLYVSGTIKGGDTPILRKYSLTGRELWTRTFGGGGGWHEDYGSYGSLAVDASGNSYVSAMYFDLPGATHYVLRKYDTNGALLWSQDNVGQSYYGSLGVDARGNLYVNSTSKEVRTGFSTVTKYRPSGSVVWQRSVTPELDELSVAPDGTWYGVSGVGSGVTLTKRSTDGWLIGTKQFGSSAAELPSVVASPYGSVYTLYRENDSAGLANHFVLNKYDAQLSWQWAKTLTDGTGNSFFSGVTVDANGKVYVLGNSSRYQGTDPNCQQIGRFDDFVTKVNPENGKTLWVKQFETGGYDNPWQGRSLTVNATGVYVAGGQTSLQQNLPDSAFITHLQ